MDYSDCTIPELCAMFKPVFAKPEHLEIMDILKKLRSNTLSKKSRKELTKRVKQDIIDELNDGYIIKRYKQ